MSTFRYTTHLPFPREDVFQWFTRPGALVRLTPSFFGSVINQPSNSIQKGSTAAMTVAAPGALGMWLGSVSGTLHGLLPNKWTALDGVEPELRWDALHTEFEDGHSFTDVMQKGPLKSWVHRHDFKDGATPGTTIMTDVIEYQLTRFPVDVVARKPFENEITRMFAFRERQLLGDLAFHAQHPRQPLTIAVSGASGLIGTQLCALLEGGGHTILRMVRHQPDNTTGSGKEIFWDPDNGILDPHALAQCDVVINLSGHTIGGRFTQKTKDLITSSRLRTTSLIASTLAVLSDDGKHRALISASGVGYYGANAADRGLPEDAWLSEDQAPGNDFLAQVCLDWEAACKPASDAGVRVVNIRTGLVLSAGGGILQRLLPLYLSGVGGPVGERQWQSWIGIDDIAGIYAHAALTPYVRGPVNGVAPHPVTAAAFAKILGQVLRRPSALKVPPVAPKALFGAQGAQELAFADQRASSAKVEKTGYQFRNERLIDALRHILGR